MNNTQTDLATTLGDVIATEDVGGFKVQQFKLLDSTPGSTTPVGTAANPLHVTSAAGAIGLTDAELRAAPVPVTGPFYQTTQPVSVAGTLPVSGTFYQATQPVSLAAQPLPAGASTEVTLAALKGVADSLLTAAQAIQAASAALNTKTTAVNTGAIAGTVAVSNFPAGGTGLTDDELRATSVPVTVSNFPVGGTGLTDTELRATPLTVSGILSATLDDTLAYLLNAILEKMPRVDSADRLIVNGSELTTTVNIGSGTVTAVTTLGTVSNQTNLGGRDASHLTFAAANSGALHIYNNIQVTA